MTSAELTQTIQIFLSEQQHAFPFMALGVTLDAVLMSIGTGIRTCRSIPILPVPVPVPVLLFLFGGRLAMTLALAETQRAEGHATFDRVAGEVAADGVFEETARAGGCGGPADRVEDRTGGVV